MDDFMKALKDSIEEDKKFRVATGDGPDTRQDIFAMIEFDLGAPVRNEDDERGRAVSIACLAYRLWARDHV